VLTFQMKLVKVLEPATLMHTSIAHFLHIFRLSREYDELREWIAGAKARSVTVSTSLTRTQWQQERELSDGEFHKGNARAALDRLSKLLARIEALQEGAALGPGSFEHCLTLARLALCYHKIGQLAAAEDRQHQALRVIDILIKREPENQDFVLERGKLLNDLGMALFFQGQYARARAACTEGLKIAEQQGNLRSQAISLNHLGMLAITEKKYSEARSLYIMLQKIGRSLSDPTLEATAWIHLGLVAREQNEWVEAERCYRESLALCEMLGDKEGAAQSCFSLGTIARKMDHPTAAESWYQYALKLTEEVTKYTPFQATVLINLASLLLTESQANHVPMTRLVEARRYAEQALTIDETLGPSSLSWEIPHILAGIATLEGRPDLAKKYRIREHEIFATDADNRQQINHQHASLIFLIAAAAKGAIPVQTEVERVLPQLEKQGWHIATAIHHLWTGERDWHILSEDLGRQVALLIRRVLETLLMSSEAVMADLPPALREAIDHGDSDAYDQVLSELPLDEQQVVAAALLYVQILDEEELALKIATIAAKGITQQDEMKAIQAQLQPPLRKVVQRIRTGEREASTLTKELDERDSALVSRVLTIIALATNIQPDQV
jgi:tetratricopeptide (TPR) repeat protein